MRSQEPQPQTSPPSPGFQCQEDKSSHLLAAKKNQWELSQWKKLLEPQAVPLKEATWTHLLRLTPSEL